MAHDILDFSKIVFVRAEYLNYVMAAAVLVLAAYLVYFWRILHLHKQFGGLTKTKELAKLTKSVVEGKIRLTLKVIFMTVIALALGLALLEPKIREVNLRHEYEPSQILIAIDSTISMLAEDVKPSRLAATKQVAENIITRIKIEGGKDKLGLIRFTDIAIPSVVVLTKDYSLIENEMELTDANYLKMFETHGTNVWDAITQGLIYFDYSKDQEKILIIISDGEQVAETKYIDDTRQEAINKRMSDDYFRSVKIFLVGIGVGSERALIPKEKDERGNVTEFYVQTEGEEKGKLLTTAPDLAYLEEVSGLINGKFIKSQTYQELNQALDDILTKERKVIGDLEDSNLKDVTPWLIGLALICLLFIPVTRLG